MSSFSAILLLVCLGIISLLTQPTEAFFDLFQDGCPKKAPLQFSQKCVASCPHGLRADENICYHVPSNLVKTPSGLPAGCNMEATAAFFSWVAYEQKTDLVGASFSNANYGNRMKAACGTWKMVNAFHNTKGIFNTHVNFLANEAAGIFIVAYRGTDADFLRLQDTVNDWVFNDGNIGKVELSYRGKRVGKVHGGFYDAYDSIGDPVVQQAMLYYNAGYRIVFTGHSKGAAVSLIALFDFIMQNSTPDNIDAMASRIYGYHFGTPLLGDSVFTTNFRKVAKNVKSFATYNPSNKVQDMVSLVPPKEIGFEQAVPLQYIYCNPQYMGNQTPLQGISQPMRVPLTIIRFLPQLGCHFPQVYLDSLLDGKLVTK